ncbi:fatty acyl-CoA synthetase [Mycolicibacterium goodii]|uniref:fatty acyl-CoA synthetase n=1 Tax=Mycolicibacterium goodii TaxID=134601 RepID=UPI000C25B9FE|nr:fatty acyl-CoA synthetase [Mycolicibacterium goodii]PJK18214.1 acyl-CoA synthetase [Mycolicibacterium goodii]
MSEPSADAVVAAVRQHSVGNLLRRTALRFPEKTAIINGTVKLNYAEFDATVDQCAIALAERGLRKSDRLVIIGRNSWHYAVLSFATARLGVVLVPVNFSLGASEVAYLLTHSRAVAVVADSEFVSTARTALDQANVAVHIRAVIGTDTHTDGWEKVDDWVTGAAVAPVEVAVDDDDPIRIMYTSGTESRPKGVLLSSKSLISQYVSCIVDGRMASDDIEIHAMPMYHCAQMDCFFSVDVYLGATSIILSQPDAATILRTIEAEGVTKFFAPPTVWIALLAHPDFDRRDLSSLRKGYYGAAAMPVEVLKEINSRLPEVSLWNFYGQTELSPVATILQPGDQMARAGSAGRPALNVETRVVDEDDRPVPTGEVGEIVHRSPHSTLGYYDDLPKTAEAFRNGWFHSGDLGRFDEDGYLTVVDRKKDMIKTGGENVASREVEEAIYLLEGVAEAAVFAVPHPRWIEAVTAVVVTRAGSDLTPDDVHAHLETRLAGYKRPKYVVFTDVLPKNPSGKILKRDLRAEYANLAD